MSAKQSVVGRLAAHPYRGGDRLPEVGDSALVSGANSDVESDQHRSYTLRKVIGYTDDKQFVCLQTGDCWPTVERLANCWFADAAHDALARISQLGAEEGQSAGEYQQRLMSAIGIARLGLAGEQ
jgi:hypothetical protein